MGDDTHCRDLTVQDFAGVSSTNSTSLFSSLLAPVTCPKFDRSRFFFFLEVLKALTLVFYTHHGGLSSTAFLEEYEVDL